MRKNLAIRNLSRNLRGKNKAQVSSFVATCLANTAAVLLTLHLLHGTSSTIIVEARELKLELESGNSEAEDRSGNTKEKENVK